MTEPAAEPTGDLRETVERWLRDRVQVPEHRAIMASYAFLALPAVRDALATQEAVKRVEFAVNEFYWLAENGHTVIDTAHIRRALAGDS